MVNLKKRNGELGTLIDRIRAGLKKIKAHRFNLAEYKRRLDLFQRLERKN